MNEMLHVAGLLVGVLSIAVVGLLLIGGIAFAVVKRDQDGEL